ncbi:MAG: SGNH/GDSL hydrolase family protein [Pirellulaceae bacterium]
MSVESLHRRSFLHSATRFATGVSAAAIVWSTSGPLARRSRGQEVVRPTSENGVDWYDVQQWGVEGRGWSDTARYFDRLPARAESKVRGAVWSLSRHSAGMVARFATSATTIHVRYRLLSNRVAMYHMPATGVSGIDLYAEDIDGHDRWLAVSRPEKQDVLQVLASGIDPLPDKKQRAYTAYLPLYNGVERLDFGVPAGGDFRPIAPRTDKPLVFYGTSIMHGACASRPGMSITGILGRRLELPVINLGFSGNGRMEKELGQFLGEIDPAIFVIDCLPNMKAAEVAVRTVPLVQQLRAARPNAPILLVEDRTYTNARFRASSRDRHTTSRAAQQVAFDKLVADGVKQLYYLPGDQLLGVDGEAATDGSHPNDLGMVRYADAYQKILHDILNQ